MSQLSLSDPPANRVRRTFPRKPGKRPFVVDLFSSPVSLKWIMALTGIAGMGFIFAHMVGNLHLYEGPEEVNSYAEALRTLGGALAPRGGVLWLMRFGLITAIAIHIYAAYRLTVVNHKARPVKYATKRDYIAADYASRTMRITGIWLVAFIIYHLVDITWGKGVDSSDWIQGDPYNNVVESFSNPIVAAFYIISMGALAFHLYHGAWSLFQSLGLNSPRYNSWRRGFATGFATIILIGNISFPVMVQMGILSQDDRCWPAEPEIEFAKEQGLSSAEIEANVHAAEEANGCPFKTYDAATDLEAELIPTDDTLPFLPTDSLPENIGPDATIPAFDPDISIPDVSVPDISLPDVSVPGEVTE